MILELAAALLSGALLSGVSLYLGVVIQRRAQAPSLDAKDKSIGDLQREILSRRKDFDSLLNRVQADDENGLRRLQAASAMNFKVEDPRPEPRVLLTPQEQTLSQDEYGRFDHEIGDPMREALNG